MEPTTQVPRWVRLALVALAVPNVLTGVWAVVWPENWFDRFPGWDPRLVAADPPFNEHLAGDAGAGFLATGVIALLAAWWGERRATQLALVGYGAFAIPHAAYHTFNPSTALTGAEDVQNAAVLVFTAAVTIGLLFVVSRQRVSQPEDGAGVP
jgi:hypothetical protein